MRQLEIEDIPNLNVGDVFIIKEYYGQFSAGEKVMIASLNIDLNNTDTPLIQICKLDKSHLKGAYYWRLYYQHSYSKKEWRYK